MEHAPKLDFGHKYIVSVDHRSQKCMYLDKQHKKRVLSYSVVMWSAEAYYDFVCVKLLIKWKTVKNGQDYFILTFQLYIVFGFVEVWIPPTTLCGRIGVSFM